MVQSSDPRNRDDLTHFSWFDRPLGWSVLLQSKVRSVSVAVGDIRPNYAAKLGLIDRDDVVQAISS